MRLISLVIALVAKDWILPSTRADKRIIVARDCFMAKRSVILSTSRLYPCMMAETTTGGPPGADGEDLDVDSKAKS